MPPHAAEVTLELTPQSRLALINISARLGKLLEGYNKALYYSYHTTAGYLDQRLCTRLKHEPQNLVAFVNSFQRLFPPGADYRHDEIELRDELTEEQKKDEPRNADAHLTFMGSGLANCVTYANDPAIPVYFIDLDGVNGSVSRQRHTTVIGFNRETQVGEVRLAIPVSSHPVDSINLRNRQLGLFEQLQEWVDREGVTQGRIVLSLDRDEQGAGLTVNEYETLLMRHDLVEVLRDPLRFMAERGKHMIQDPKAIPLKAKGYAKYDFVQVLNEFFDAMGLSESLLERVIHRFLAFPAARFLRMKRSVSLLVSSGGDSGTGKLVQGRYQSPVLVQWGRAEGRERALRVSLVRFD